MDAAATSLLARFLAYLRDAHLAFNYAYLLREFHLSTK